MGFFSDLEWFREAGEEPNENNVKRFGEPARSLFTAKSLLSMRQHIDIFDKDENIVYQVNSAVFSFDDKTDIKDASGRQVARIEREILSFHQRHTVKMADGTGFEISREIFHLIDDVINIEGLGWLIKGDFMQLNFELYGEDGRIIALVGQKMISFHDKYCIDIYRPEYEETVIAILIALQHMIHDRERSRR